MFGRKKEAEFKRGERVYVETDSGRVYPGVILSSRYTKTRYLPEGWVYVVEYEAPIMDWSYDQYGSRHGKATGKTEMVKVVINEGRLFSV